MQSQTGIQQEVYTKYNPKEKHRLAFTIVKDQLSLICGEKAYRTDKQHLALIQLASSPGYSQILSHSCGEKSGEGLGSKLRHDRKWWTLFRNDGNVPTHNVAGIGQFNPPRRFCQQLWTSQVPSH